jgi:hypothetical protein
MGVMVGCGGRCVYPGGDWRGCHERMDAAAGTNCGRRTGLGLGLDAAYIPRKHDENHWIDDRWLQIVELFGPTWASLFIVFLFLFSFLLHHCEVTLKNNYVIQIYFLYITVWIQVFI